MVNYDYSMFNLVPNLVDILAFVIIKGSNIALSSGWV